MAKEEKILDDGTVVDDSEAIEADANNGEDILKKQPSHYKRPTIFYSRIWTLSAAAIILITPVIIAVYYSAGPNWAAVIGGLLAVVPIYWPVTIIEQFTYTPLLGPSATMLSLVTGNLTNMKIPAALSALEKFKAQPGSETGKIICLLACSTCALVSIIVCCLGVAGLSVMKPVLDNPVLSPAFGNLLPALFGSLCVTFFKKDWKIAILPCSVMVFLFICFPFLSQFGGLLVPVAIVISVGSARIMFKQGLLDEKEEKEEKKVEVWIHVKAFLAQHKKMIRFVAIPVTSLLIVGVVVLNVAGQFVTSPFTTHENAQPQYIQKYMSEVWYDKDYEYDLDAVQNFMKGAYPEGVSKSTGNSNAKCLSITNNGLYGHNYDWIKDYIDEYVVHVQATSDRYASVGVASAPVSTYTELPSIEPNTFNNDALASIPFCVVDGMNEKGVYCALNRTANYDNLNTDNVETKPGAQELYSFAVPRFVLDKCQTADQALLLLREMNIVSPEEKVHFMIGDANRYYVVEVSSGRTTVLVDQVLSNFDLSETNKEIYSTGYERYNIATDYVSNILTVDEMMDVLSKCWYSKVFDSKDGKLWYSDLYDLAIDNGDLPVDNNMTEGEIYTYLDKFYKDHNLTFNLSGSDNMEVCSVHSTVYDSKNKRMYLVNQEGLAEYTFSINDMIDDGTGDTNMFSSLGS